MVDEHFCIRGFHIDKQVANDEEATNPDNVVIGETTGLSTSDRFIRVYAGAGDDLLQFTGVPCNAWTGFERYLEAELGTGINVLSFQAFKVWIQTRCCFRQDILVEKVKYSLAYAIS